ncbi:MAG: hypothetical protein A3K19_24850 [Lentisphaerae bacterium RIFOXYB12_FULL_65_16]|nr:MAG: hypothetical protein A3K18_24265 [Lentisphaerae bacterium RIFOXYA12_64_32]OGV90701.1 MAG: hypothetical protein A3K19_24850 [Lentisphaerae bacterium RIFOXYB12_FULL_65_16]
MKFVASRELRLRPAGVWEDVRTFGEVVITSNGQPVAVMAPVTGETFEATVRALRRARAEATLRSIQDDARRRGVSFSAGQIDAVIRKTRKARRW